MAISISVIAVPCRRHCRLSSVIAAHPRHCRGSGNPCSRAVISTLSSYPHPSTSLPPSHRHGYGSGNPCSRAVISTLSSYRYPSASLPPPASVIAAHPRHCRGSGNPCSRAAISTLSSYPHPSASLPPSHRHGYGCTNPCSVQSLARYLHVHIHIHQRHCRRPPP